MAGIYIHIPFCRQKCHYCNFYSIASLKYKQQVLHAIISELFLRKDYLGNETVETIYFGGGTPSLLLVQEVKNILEKIYSSHKIAENPEITIEANPDDLSEKWVKNVGTTCINRFSVGVQSFFDEDLKYLHRVHNARQAEDSLKLLIDKGFENISIDLIFGIPGLTVERWKKNLDKALILNIPHISAYALTVEPKTALENFIRKNKITAPDEKQSVDQFIKTMEWSRKNEYLHYEISNYCKKGFISKHNSNYWKGEKYLGAGPSAHSFNGVSRQWNVAGIDKYIEAINNNIIPCEKETLTVSEKYNEFIMTRLRTMWGIDLVELKDKFGKKYFDLCLSNSRKNITEGMMRKENKKLLLTDKGKIFADRIASDLFTETRNSSYANVSDGGS